MQGAPPRIVLDQVRKWHGDYLALGPVTLEVADGEFFVIVGPSGCGKTTLLRMLAGLDVPSEGRLAIAAGSSGAARRAVVFQGDSLLPWMTVTDNAAYGLRMAGMPAREARAHVQSLLQVVGLHDARDKYPHQLSGGMRQRVSIARAFAVEPDILLMDEPFSALDEQNRLVLQEELLRIWEATGKTVVFITHSVDEAVTLGDTIMLMTAGPGRAKTTVRVDLERPRSVLELRHTPRYGEIVYEIWGHLRGEVQLAGRGRA